MQTNFFSPKGFYLEIGSIPEKKKDRLSKFTKKVAQRFRGQMPGIIQLCYFLLITQFLKNTCSSMNNIAKRFIPDVL